MNCILKVFITLLILGPILIVALILSIIAIIANIFTLLYFVLFGWFCEVKICDDCCHGPFISKTLYKPRTLLITFGGKIIDFICEKSKKKKKVHTQNTTRNNIITIQNTSQDINEY